MAINNSVSRNLIDQIKYIAIEKFYSIKIAKLNYRSILTCSQAS